MRLMRDPFIDAVDRAIQRLADAEGRRISVAEIIRRTNLPSSRRSAVHYHLNRNVDRRQGHNVPAWLVEGLAEVLPITAGELTSAARQAAGFAAAAVATTGSEIVEAVSAFYADPELTSEERARVTASLLRTIAALSRRRLKAAFWDTAAGGPSSLSSS